MPKSQTEVIAIDGQLGAGKTTYSKTLSSEYGLPIIHVDDFLNAGQNQYVAAIRVDDLKKAIESTKMPAIIEGVCLLEILSRVGVVPKFHIFLYRSDGNNYISGNPLVIEVEKYINQTNAPQKADKVINMRSFQTNQLDVAARRR